MNYVSRPQVPVRCSHITFRVIYYIFQKVNRKSPPSQLRNLLSAKPSSQSTSTSKATNQNVESTSPDDIDKGDKRSNRNSPEVARNSVNDDPIQTSQTRPNNDDCSEPIIYPAIRVKTDLEATDVKNEECEALCEDPDRDRCDFNADLLEPKMEVMEQDVSDDERAGFPQMYYENALVNPFAALSGEFT